jgi:uncharacterized membrane protein
MAYLPRDNFWLLLAIYSLLFLIYAAVCRYATDQEQHIKPLLVFSVFCRLVFIFSIPMLSDDFYRFLWDGHLLIHGLNPYTHLPVEVLEHMSATDPVFYKELFLGLNSPEYYSIYPPINQVVFAMAAYIGRQDLLLNLLVIRGVLFVFEVGVVFLLYQLTVLLDLPKKNVLVYALNPLVLLEIGGNLHFEGIMLFFVLAAIYFVAKQPKMSGISLGTAIGVKLTPVILVPAFFRFVFPLKRWVFVVSLSMTAAVMMAPVLLDGAAPYFLESLGLYHGKFEFNASVYYLIRNMVMWIVGFNPIAILSPLLGLITWGLIIWISLKYDRRERDVSRLVETAVVLYLIYLILHPVVHPWYLLVPFGISVLGAQRSFLVWAYVVVLSYAGYQSSIVEESWWLQLIQYGTLIFFIWRDSLFIRKKVLIC